MIIDEGSMWLGIAVGVAVTAIISAVVWINYYLNERDWRRKLMIRNPERTQPICGCQHHRSFHDKEGCHHIGSSGYREEIACGCKVYIGPAVSIPALTPEEER